MYLGIQIGSSTAHLAHAGPQTAPALVADRKRVDLLFTEPRFAVVSEGILVGESVSVLAHASPQTAIAGLAWADCGLRDPCLTDGSKQIWTTADLLVVLLRKLLLDVRTHVAERLDTAVLAVPSTQIEIAQKLLPHALQLAGWPEMDWYLIDELTAAAVFHGVPTAYDDGRYLVMDLGAAGVRCGLIQGCSRDPNDLAVTVNDHCSANALETRLSKLAAAALTAGAGVELSPFDRQLIQRTARSWLAAFCQPSLEHLDIALRLTGSVHQFSISRPLWRRLLAPLVETTCELSESLLRSRMLRWDDLRAVVLVGGGMHWPEAATAITQRSGLPPERIWHRFPQRAVACGAALAARLVREGGSLPLVRLSPVENRTSVGFLVLDRTTQEPTIDVLIPADAQLPASKQRRYVLNRNDQDRLVLKAVAQFPGHDRLLRLGEVNIEAERDVTGKPYYVTIRQESHRQVHVEVEYPTPGKTANHRFVIPQQDEPDLTLFHPWSATTPLI